MSKDDEGDAADVVYMKTSLTTRWFKRSASVSQKAAKRSAL
jgi:hypothetical protein